MLTEIGRYLRKMRVDHGQTIGEMASQIGVSLALLSAIETGRNRLTDKMIKMLDDYILDVDPFNFHNYKRAVILTVDFLQIEMKDLSENQKLISEIFIKSAKKLTDYQINKISETIKGE